MKCQMMLCALLFLLPLSAAIAVSETADADDQLLSETIVEVIEGDDVTLTCSFHPSLMLEQNHLLWKRFADGYVERIAHLNETRKRNTEVHLNKRMGKYDLKIIRANYSYHDGIFECVLLDVFTLKDLRRRTQLNVLAIPQGITMTLQDPVFTEGKSTEVFCNSTREFRHCRLRYMMHSLGESRVLYGTTSENCTSKLEFIPSRKDDGGKLTCELFNDKLNMIHSVKESLNISVQYAPQVFINSSDVVLQVLEGQALTLDCVVTANPNATEIIWMFRDEQIGDTPSLILGSIAREDGGTYTCTALNKIGTSNEASIKIVVQYPPTVEPLQDVEPNLGQDINVTCRADASPRVEYFVWGRSGVETFKVLGPTLAIKNVTQNSTDAYDCLAINQMRPAGHPDGIVGNGRASFRLTVRYPPKPAKGSRSEIVGAVEETLVVKCASEGYPTPIIRWRIAGTEEVLGVGPTLHLKLSRKLHGIIVCEGQNIVGTGEAWPINVEVLQKPHVTRTVEKGLQVSTGTQNFAIIFETASRPQANVTCFKDEDQINSLLGEVFVKTSHTPRQDSTYENTVEIKFAKIVPENRGNYTCAFENDVGTTFVSSPLRVIDKPTFIDAEKNRQVFVEIGEEANLYCEVYSIKKPTILWTGGTWRHQINFSSSGKDTHESTLTIKRVGESDFGEFWCEASNSVGISKFKVDLKHASLSSPPHNVTAIPHGSNTLAVQWENAETRSTGPKLMHILKYRKTSAREVNEKDCRDANPCTISVEPRADYIIEVTPYNAFSVGTAATIHTQIHPSTERKTGSMFQDDVDKFRISVLVTVFLTSAVLVFVCFFLARFVFTVYSHTVVWFLLQRGIHRQTEDPSHSDSADLEETRGTRRSFGLRLLKFLPNLHPIAEITEEEDADTTDQVQQDIEMLNQPCTSQRAQELWARIQRASKTRKTIV